MKTDINQYLLLEFGLNETEADIDRVSDEWPFALHECGTVRDADGAETHIFEFDHQGAGYFATYGHGINYFPSDGLTRGEFALQVLGSHWIGAREPVDLNTSKGDHPVVPRIPDRRATIENLAKKLDAHGSFRIAEGLFLEKTKEHLALVIFAPNDTATIVGDRITVRNIPFPQLSASRRLAIGIGKLVEQGRLNQPAH